MSEQSRLAETQNARSLGTHPNPHIGSFLEGFLSSEGILEESPVNAIQEAAAWQIQQAMQRENVTKLEMARRKKTSRAAHDRLLYTANASVTLQTLTRAAHAIGRHLRTELIRGPRDSHLSARRPFQQIARPSFDGS